MLFNHEEVLKFLPHRAPFLFVDTVERVVVDPEVLKKEVITSKDLVGSEVVAHFEVRKDLKILEGHFPGNPILPGVIQVEMMAQTSAFVSIAFNNMEKEGVRVETLLLGVESCRFRKPILPGMKLEIHAVMEKCRGPIAYYNCNIFSGGEKVSEAKFLAKLDVIK